jgi:hypothetical protein
MNEADDRIIPARAPRERPGRSCKSLSAELRGMGRPRRPRAARDAADHRSCDIPGTDPLSRVPAEANRGTALPPGSAIQPEGSRNPCGGSRGGDARHPRLTRRSVRIDACTFMSAIRAPAGPPQPRGTTVPPPRHLGAEQADRFGSGRQELEVVIDRLPRPNPHASMALSFYRSAWGKSPGAGGRSNLEMGSRGGREPRYAIPLRAQGWNRTARDPCAQCRTQFASITGAERSRPIMPLAKK